MEINKTKILEVAVLAGKILLENGADMTRVEDTMLRIGRNAGLKNVVAFVTPTGIFISLRGEPCSQMESIQQITMNLEKVAYVNQQSRRFGEGTINISEFYQLLQQIDEDIKDFDFWLKTLAASLVSASLMYIFGGEFRDFFATFVVGGIGYILYYFLNQRTEVDFLNNGLVAFVIALLAGLFVRLHLGTDMNMIIIGSVMPLVPGVKITNAFLDGISGHTISSMTSGLQALLTAGSIGVGVAIALKLLL